MQVATPPQQDLAQPQYEITAQDKERVQRTEEAWAAYRGELPDPLKPLPGETRNWSNVKDNPIFAAINAARDFLFGKELGIVAEEGAPEEAQALLDLVWGEKEARIPLLQKLYLNGTMAGTAFLRIVPDDDAFRLIALNPSTVFVKTVRGDCETVDLYCIEYREEEGTASNPLTVYYREEIKRITATADKKNSQNALTTKAIDWEFQHWTRVGDRGPWTPAGEPYRWGYATPPIFHCQNLTLPSSLWGLPLVTAILIGINNAINFGYTNAAQSNKFYGNPLLTAYGVASGSIRIEPGRVTELPSPDSKMEAIQITSDLANQIMLLDKLHQLMEAQTSVPRIAMGVTEGLTRGVISGLAIKMLFSALTMQNDSQQCLYGKMILDASRAILAFKNMSKDIKVSLSWLNPIPTDDLADLQAAILKKQLGYSDDTLIRESGGDPEEESAKKQQEDAQIVTNYSRGIGLPPQQPMPNQQGGMMGQEGGTQ